MKQYTAQEMRETADGLKDDPGMDALIIADMLRQAADMMDSMRHEYKLKKKRQKGVATQIIVRRDVGEWEEVRE